MIGNGMLLAAGGQTEEPGKAFDYTIGAELEGGFYAGTVMSDFDGMRYAIVVSPAVGGDSFRSNNSLKWQSTASLVSPGFNVPPMTLSDGFRNHAALVAKGIAGFPAAQWIEMQCNASAGLNGYRDWYLPSRDELELLYRNFRPGSAPNFLGTRYASATGFGADGLMVGVNNNSIPSGAAYTSTSPARTTVPGFIDGGANALAVNNYLSSTEIDAGAAWYQKFTDGNQSRANKGGFLAFVRAVRRVPLD